MAVFLIFRRSHTCELSKYLIKICIIAETDELSDLIDLVGAEMPASAAASPREIGFM